MTRSEPLCRRPGICHPVRNGFTLLELVIALTIGSVLVLLAVGLINKAFELRTAAIFRVELSSKLDQVARQFRRAARMSDSAVVGDDASELQFKMMDGATQVFKFDGTTLRVSSGEADSDTRQVLLEARLNAGPSGNRICQFSVKDQTATLVVETNPHKPGIGEVQLDSKDDGKGGQLDHVANSVGTIERVVSSRVGRWRLKVPDQDASASERLEAKSAAEGDSDE